MCTNLRSAFLVLLIGVLSGSTLPAQAGPQPPADEYLPCDTWVALPDATAPQATILAKNSDRPLFDCQPLLFHPRRKWQPGARIELGRISIPQVEETFATLGSSPYWCWGYEEGINEFGVAIGNEGIWTRTLLADLEASTRGEAPELGPTGMDLLRLGLERGRSAREALEVITGLLEQHGQFGSGIPSVPLAVGAYENSFLIADPEEAWILETSGRRWIARRVAEGTASISNCLSIGTDWERSSPDLVSHAVERAWWGSEAAEHFDFAAALADDTAAGVGRTARAQARADCSADLLEQRAGDIDSRWMMRIARDRSSTPSLDLDQTASSCVAVLPDAEGGLPVFWWCPTTPSNSCYVPFFVHGSALPDVVQRAGKAGRTIVAPSLAVPDTFAEESYWWQFRDLCDQARRDYAERNPVIRAEFDRLEQAFAAELPAVLAEAAALRAEGKVTEAAARLDLFSASCVEQALEKAKELRARFAGEQQEVPAAFAALVGNYLSTVSDNQVTVLVQEERLALEIPGQGVYSLEDPDASGRRRFVVTDQAAVSFLCDDFGAVQGMLLHQGEVDIELVREGVVLPPEMPLAELQEYLGQYYWDSEAVAVTVFVQNNRLAIRWPGRMIFELHPPDASGAWRFRLGNSSAVRFDRDAEGGVASMSYLRDGDVEEVLVRLADEVPPG